MLKKILSIGGKPGLFKLISQSKNMIIVESLLTGKRTPSYGHEKAISLGDIAIFTTEGETPLYEIFETIYNKEEKKTASIDPKSDATKLYSYFSEILPSFDRDRVYPTDIKKVITWYNLLVEKELTDFAPITDKSKPAEIEQA